ncbi:uncharacterized protein PHACADRAFT_185950 [Phanerochaete carnosa HHB-10118-sp]|uniref:Uncharacterized protein n=1 Tax=Phanerochaete carnosa (strain HHB-10118-sp) TaxID=650164 RepID=K5VP59_PHACS|nr:uncharacterized protein PHACADRAFT_185950 [Phanerochaete carnosa HHB-10118-sp]EKM53253.1 hypothetical protein PHACADRAFT_185950 [Phanerochaete carnosa HHB-10118-sp]
MLSCGNHLTNDCWKARLADVEATIGTRIDDEFGRAIRHMQGIIALHNRRSRLEDDMDWMQSSLEGRRCSTANSDAAADEEVVSLLEQLTESEDRLEDAETKTHERLTAAKSVKVGIDDAGAECHLVLVERDGLRKHLAYMHTSNCLEAEDCDADVAGLEAQRTLLETSCEQTIYRADITTSKVDALTEEVDHIVLASHHAQQALIGDLAGASSEASSLAADLAKQDTELTDLKTTHSALEDSCSQLDEHAESLESTLAQLEADEVGLRATSLKEADDHQERVMALEAEHDAVDASHAAAVEKLSKVKADADRVAQETLALVGSLREKQAANKVRFDEATAALKASIARDDADIAERKAACVAQEHSLKVTKAALDTRNDVFRLHAQDYERDMEASWSLGKESGYDRQQYESMLDEASNKAARARRQQADAEAKAAAARQHSDEVAKETAVTRHAFTTQLGDLEAQRTALGSANAAFATSSEQLRADNSALGAKLEHLKKAHDDEKRPLSIRLRSAEADMARFKMTEAEAVNRLDVQIAGLATEEEGLNGKMAEYQSELGRVYGMTEGVERAVSEASLALSVEKGQALALLKLIRYPSSDPEFIAAYWTPETPSEGASSRPPERYDSCSAIFDASFEEALERDIAEM